MREITFFLRLQVKQKDEGIFISQDKYVADILKKFDFTTMKTASTLMEPNKALIKDAETEDVDVHLYRSMIGSLMYLTASKADIMFVVCACARFQVTPKTSHLHAMKRIFRYLKGLTKQYDWIGYDDTKVLKITLGYNRLVMEIKIGDENAFWNKKLRLKLVKKLEKIVKSTNAKRRAKIVVSVDEDAVEDSSKQGRKIDDIDQDLNISLVQYDAKVQGRHEQEIKFETKDISTAETLVYIKRSASKDKAVRLQEQLDEEERQRIARVMAASTIHVSAEKNLGNPINIRVDIIHPEPVAVVAFLAATVMRTQA
nr:uncharacterized mitochondrial protein AtMg00810-like [Tanacetum cinerariifolium]